MEENKKWYKSTWFTILMLIFVYPVGIVLMWLYRKNWKTAVKGIITAIAIVIFFASALGNNENKQMNTEAVPTQSPIPVSEVTDPPTLEPNELPTQQPTAEPTNPPTAVPIATEAPMNSYNTSSNASDNTTTTSSSGSSSSSTYGNTSSGYSSSSESSGRTVYIGETGTKYHRQSCRTLKNGAYPISLNEALSEGREPCGVCKP